MNQVDVGKKSLGVHFTEDGKAEVILWAPKLENVSLHIINTNKKIELQQQEFGYWTATTTDLKHGDLYKYVIDKDQEFPDPASISQPEGVHGPSQALPHHYTWKDSDWNNIPLNEYILYELHTGTFSPEGTFEGIEAKLDYLKELGVNAIEIMPVAQFPGGRNWGYDGVFPFAVQSTYGGPEGLKKLVDACHAKGIAVVLDVVYNHMGPEGNYLGLYGHYFTDKYNTPWGNAINFDDAHCDAVRKYFIENALMWFRDYHIDALRMDAVHAIKDFSPTHILREIKQYVNQLMEQTGRTHYLIVELDLNDNRFINPLEKQGFGMDAQWVDEFHHALRVTAGEPQTGYYADFTGIAHLAKAYKDAYVYDGIYSPHRSKVFGIKADGNQAHQFVVFSQNHDQVGNRMLGERTSQLVSFEMQKLMAASVLLSPYLPMLWMGEEYSEPNPFLYFVSHTDPELAEAVRKGRKAEFAAFHAEGEAPDPVDEKTFEQSKLQWELIEKDQHQVMLRYYKQLIRMRKLHPALSNLSREHLEVSHSEEQKTLTLHRWHEDYHVWCLMNFSQSEQKVQLPSNDQQVFRLFNSASSLWNGPIEDEQEETLPTVTLQPESVIIYSNKHV